MTALTAGITQRSGRPKFSIASDIMQRCLADANTKFDLEIYSHLPKWKWLRPCKQTTELVSKSQAALPLSHAAPKGL